MKKITILLLMAFTIALTGCKSSQEISQKQAPKTEMAVETKPKSDYVRPAEPVMERPDAGRMRLESQQMVEKLGLSADQKTQYELIIQKYDQMHRAAMNKNQSDRAAMQQELYTIRMEQDAEIRSILTAEQSEIFNAVQESSLERN